MGEWIRVNKENPCPICERLDWCCVTSDGKLVNCMRVESNKPCKNGGWLHRLDEPIQIPKPRSKKRVPVKNFGGLTKKYYNQLTEEKMNELSKDLGVSKTSLHRLQVGWDGRNFAFPMKDAFGKIIGIRLRGNNRKFSVTGSKTGIFWPIGIHKNNNQLWICEGPTDCGTLLDMGFNAIGRPSCLGGTDIIKAFLSDYDREVIIIADKDAPKRHQDGSEWKPGQEGAYRLAQSIKSLVRSVKVVKPPFCKDIREWYNAGCTAEMLLTIVEMAKYL